MSKVLSDVLSTLGLHGLENEEDFALIELLLSNVDAENILSPDEQEMLENADFSFLGSEVETGMLEVLKSNGIEEECLNMDDMDREYIENKLSCMEYFLWDSKIDTLCKQKDHMEKVLRELNRRSSDFHLGKYIEDSEREWTKIQVCFDTLFEDLQQIESYSKNPENTRTFQLFLDAHQNGLDKFIEVYNRYLNSIVEVKMNLNGDKEEYFLHENGVPQMLGCSENFCALQSRLTCAFFNNHCKYTNSGLKLFMAACERKSTASEIESVSDEYFVSVLTVCEKWAELHIKENIILPKLDESKELRELSMEMCSRLLPILHEQLALEILVSTVAYIWLQDQNGSSDVLRSCYQHFQEELSNVLARVRYLEEAQKKYESYFNSEEYKNSLLETLRRLSGKVISNEEKYITEIIDEKEKELQVLINQQNADLQNGNKIVTDAEEEVERMRLCINSNMRIVSQFEEGYKASLSQLQVRKDDMMGVTEQLTEDPVYCKSRLLWVYFFTDHNKLHQCKALKDLESPKHVCELSFTSSTPKSFIGTSTPKKQEEEVLKL